MHSKNAVLIGATGLVGGHLLTLLLNHPSYALVTVFVRKKIAIEHPKLKQIIVDFDNLDASIIKAEEVFCAIGTTLKKAGSKQAQYHIDCEIPYNFAKIAIKNGVKKFLLVSSLGADAHSSNFYLSTKGQLEEKISSLKFETFFSARPSILFGDRAEKRTGEGIGIKLAKLIEPILFGKLKKYAGIKAKVVAKALIMLAETTKKGEHYIESDGLNKIAKN
jgi:uncharacterized protein YbjT (DUF2867 family)